jgi:uncharacterized protein
MRYSDAAITTIHQQYAASPTVYELVWTHSLIVRDIARQLIKHSQLAVDSELVRLGALLHDIGVYRLLQADGSLRPGAHYITHGIEGEAILQREGFPEAVWRFAAHHTGVGITRQDIVRQKLPLPANDYLAESAEEQLVMYADKFHSKTMPPHFNSYDWCRHDLAQFGDDIVKRFEQLSSRFGRPDLDVLRQQYHHTVR